MWRREGGGGGEGGVRRPAECGAAGVFGFPDGLEVPAGLKSGRFGVKHYHHPELSLNLSDDTPEGEFLHLLDHATLRMPDSGVDKTLWQTHNWQPPGDSLAAHLRMSGPQLPFLTRCAKEDRAAAGKAGGGPVGQGVRLPDGPGEDVDNRLANGGGGSG
jgi:hypothetical protein